MTLLSTHLTRYAAGSAALNAASESDLNEDDFVLLPGTNELLVFNLHRFALTEFFTHLAVVFHASCVEIRNCSDDVEKKRVGILSEPLVEVEEKESDLGQEQEQVELRDKSKSEVRGGLHLGNCQTKFPNEPPSFFLT